MTPSWPRWQLNLRLLVCQLCLLHLLGVAAVWLQATETLLAEDVQQLDPLGLKYSLLERKSPRVLRIHVLEVDLTRQQVQFRVVTGADPDGPGPAEAELTLPHTLAEQVPGVIAAVNTNAWAAIPTAADPQPKSVWFPGQPVEILGLAVTQGRVASAAQPGYANGWITAEGRVKLSTDSPKEPIQEGWSGFSPLVLNGQRIESRQPAIHPRTAIGTDETGLRVWLVVVDGRQPGYSEGLALDELAELMQSLGCWQAHNLDGGGSSILLMKRAGKTLETINSPSDRAFNRVTVIRPLPVMLCIQPRDVGKRSATQTEVPGGSSNCSIEASR
jgi:hypothetical protein